MNKHGIDVINLSRRLRRISDLLSAANRHDATPQDRQDLTSAAHEELIDIAAILADAGLYRTEDQIDMWLKNEEVKGD